MDSDTHLNSLRVVNTKDEYANRAMRVLAA
jgi:hypothetical protein